MNASCCRPRLTLLLRTARVSVEGSFKPVIEPEALERMLQRVDELAVTDPKTQWRSVDLVRTHGRAHRRSPRRGPPRGRRIAAVLFIALSSAAC